MRALVVGGTAFVGPPVVKKLREAGHEVLVFHRGRTEHEYALPAAGVEQSASGIFYANAGCNGPSARPHVRGKQRIMWFKQPE